MAKKHWIYLKRGLSENPKHRARMGECIWLYMHIIDRADWETGAAYDWKDNEEAADMGMEVTTLRYQRRKLETLGYIICTKKQHSQDIIILEWVNPRDYSAGVMNRRADLLSNFQSDNPLSLSEEAPQSDNQSVNPLSLSDGCDIQSDNQSYNQSDNQSVKNESNPETLTLSESESESIGGVPPAMFGLDWHIAAGARVTREVLDLEKRRQMEDVAGRIAETFGINAPVAREIALAFMKARGIVIGERKIKGQQVAVRDMIAGGVRGAHVEKAVKKLKDAGMTITDLFSVSETAIDLANEMPEESAPVPESVLATKRRLERSTTYVKY